MAYVLDYRNTCTNHEGALLRAQPHHSQGQHRTPTSLGGTRSDSHSPYLREVLRGLAPVLPVRVVLPYEMPVLVDGRVVPGMPLQQPVHCEPVAHLGGWGTKS